MAGWRWLRALLAALLVLAMVSCSDDGDDDGDASADVTQDDDGDDADDGSDDDGSDDGDDGGDADLGALEDLLGDEGCAGLVGLSAQLAAAFSGTGSGDLDDAAEIYDALAADAPEEIRDDFAVFADFFSAYIGALEDAGIDLSDPQAFNDPEAAQRFAAALGELEGEFDEDALTEAGENIGAWAETNCPDLVED